MKKITLLAAVLFGFAVNAQVLLTQSIDPETVNTGGVACWGSATGEYRENSFWRSYDLNDFGIEGNFEISELQWGQGSADNNNQLFLNIYIVDNEDLFSASDFELVASTTHSSSSADDNSLVTASLSAVIPAGSIIAFEINAPDGGSATDVRFFPGFNGAGELATGYLQAAECGITFPTPPADIGFPDNQYVMNILGEEIPLSVNDNIADLVTVYPTPAVDVINIRVPSYIEVSEVTLHDIQGRNTGSVFSNGTINVSSLSRGVYMLTVKTSEGTLTQKVVKK